MTRSGVPGLQPELWVDSGMEALAFYESAFGAKVLHRVGDGDDIVAQLAVGDAAFWIATAGGSTERLVPRAIGGATGRVLLVVDDPDTFFAQAVTAGAQAKSPVDEEHGWRVGRLVDPFGHEWKSAHHSPLGRRSHRRDSGILLRPTASRRIVGSNGMKRVLIGAGATYVLFAVIGRFVEAMGAATCPCAADCWCKRLGLSMFRWVAPIGHRVMAHVDDDGDCSTAA